MHGPEIAAMESAMRWMREEMETRRLDLALGRLEPRPSPSKDERLMADTGLDPATLRRALGRPFAAAGWRDARSLAARSLALDGLR